jgi:uncharacterized coiled-coil protein SlyX
MSETRLDHLEIRLAGFDERLRHIEETVIRIATLLEATLPHLATKAKVADLRADLTNKLADLRADLANKPSRGYLWTVMAAMIASFAAALAAVGVLLPYLPHH